MKIVMIGNKTKRIIKVFKYSNKKTYYILLGCFFKNKEGRAVLNKLLFYLIM